MTYRNLVMVGTLLLFGAAGCADLDISNPNEPGAELALGEPGDVESLIGGAFSSWHSASNNYVGINMALGNMSHAYGSSAANSGAVFHSSFPRPELVNNPAGAYYPNMEHPWVMTYRSLSAVAEGLRAVEASEEIQDAIDVTRITAYGKFMQGLAHATIAILYDKGFVIDETVELTDDAGIPITLGEEDALGYQDLMTAALGYFDDAIALAEGEDFTTPAGWMTQEMTAEELALLARSLKGRYRAAVARTPEERAAVDWQAVHDDLEDGLQADWEIDLDFVFDNWQGYNISHYYTSQPGSWAYTMYWIEGMADQSGRYQDWVDMPNGDKHPNLGRDEPFIIETPDERFPQGSTLQEQAENPGEYYRVPVNADGEASVASQWAQPSRGQWRWSYYDSTTDREHHSFLYGDAIQPEFSLAEQRLLMAEALYRLDREGEAADIVNETRTEWGLNATDAAGTNTSCVPRLPNGECGGLMEMIKWELRLEAKLLGLMQDPSYFHGRGWGDLYEGTALHFPIPSVELQTLGMQQYTFGGIGNPGAADSSSYAWEELAQD